MVTKIPRSKRRQGGECCYVDEDGNVFNQALRDAIIEGASPFSGAAEAREALKGIIPEDLMDTMLPLK